MINICILASGNGSNAENIVRHFEGHPQIQVKEILSNKQDAFVHERAKNLHLPSSTISKEAFQQPAFLEQLKNMDYIILAGFLWLIPSFLVEAFPKRIINIHPALLPKFGGKGMYGDNVHRAVIASGETKSGITIHLVNEEYDKGTILFQANCEVSPNDTAETLAKKVHDLEYEHFPHVIEEYILSNL